MNIGLELFGPDGRIRGDGLWRGGDIGERGSAVSVMPTDAVRKGLKWRIRRVGVGTENVTEYVSGMIQDDVEDGIHPTSVDLIYQGPQFVVGELRIVAGGCGIGSEARLGVEEVLNAVAVEGAGFVLAILENGSKPERADAEISQITEFLANAFKSAALELAEGLVEGDWRCLGGGVWRGGWIVETVDHEEIDPGVAPVGRGSEGDEDFGGSAVDSDRSRLGGAEAVEEGLDFGSKDGGLHRGDAFLGQDIAANSVPLLMMTGI